MEMRAEAPEFDVQGTRSGWHCWEERVTVFYTACWVTNLGGAGCDTVARTDYISACAFLGGGGGDWSGGFGGGNGSITPDGDASNSYPSLSPSLDSVAPFASQIFDVSNLTKEEREALERMIKEVTEDCMGANLYRALLGFGTMPIEFNDTGYRSTFRPSDRRISLHSMNDSPLLFHEMFHAYQRNRTTPAQWVTTGLNREIEAWFAMYSYVGTLSENPNSQWDIDWELDHHILNNIRRLQHYIDYWGELQPGITKDDFELHMTSGVLAAFRLDPVYRDMSHNANISGLAHFENMQRLTKNCTN